jgi:hypothetical protein
METDFVQNHPRLGHIRLEGAFVEIGAQRLGDLPLVFQKRAARSARSAARRAATGRVAPLLKYARWAATSFAMSIAPPPFVVLFRFYKYFTTRGEKCKSGTEAFPPR